MTSSMSWRFPAAHRHTARGVPSRGSPSPQLSAQAQPVEPREHSHHQDEVTEVTPEMSVPSEMKNALASAVNAPEAIACRSTGASLPKTRPGSSEAQTKSKPIRAALAPALSIKQPLCSGGTIPPCTFL
jgi:hypothetical protein